MAQRAGLPMCSCEHTAERYRRRCEVAHQPDFTLASGQREMSQAYGCDKEVAPCFPAGPSLPGGAWLWLAWPCAAWINLLLDMGISGLVCLNCVLGGSSPLFLLFRLSRKLLDYRTGGLIRSVESELRFGNIGKAVCRIISDKSKACKVCLFPGLRPLG